MTRSSFRASPLQVKRVYEPVSPDDGLRILIDRRWPRGLSKAEAALDEWAKDIAPSTELRQWCGHDPSAGRSFSAATRSNFINTPKRWIVFALWPRDTQSRSSTVPMTRNTMMRSY